MRLNIKMILKNRYICSVFLKSESINVETKWIITYALKK